MKLEGVFVPMITPSTRDGGVDTQALAKLAEHFIAQGVTCLIACGTTGEYYAFTEEERRQVMETIAAVGKGRVSLVAGISAFSTQGSIERAKQAEELGYDGLMLTAPPYCLPSQDGVITHFREVAAATPLPIIMYNFPDRVGVDLEFDTVVELAKVPNIVGIKESSGDFGRALALIQAKLPDFEVVCGCDEQAADFLFWGVRAWISGSANVFPAEQVAMIEAAKAGRLDEVRDLLSAMYPVIHDMESSDFNQKAKLAAKRHGIEPGEIRRPLAPLTAGQAQAFQQLLDAYKH